MRNRISGLQLSECGMSKDFCRKLPLFVCELPEQKLRDNASMPVDFGPNLLTFPSPHNHTTRQCVRLSAALQAICTKLLIAIYDAHMSHNVLCLSATAELFYTWAGKTNANGSIVACWIQNNRITSTGSIITTTVSWQKRPQNEGRASQTKASRIHKRQSACAVYKKITDAR